MNLLSYQQGTNFTGGEIKEWAFVNSLSSDPSKKAIANYIVNHYGNLVNNGVYTFYMSHKNSDCRHKRIPLFIRSK